MNPSDTLERAHNQLVLWPGEGPTAQGNESLTDGQRAMLTGYSLNALRRCEARRGLARGLRREVAEPWWAQ